MVMMMMMIMMMMMMMMRIDDLVSHDDYGVNSKCELQTHECRKGKLKKESESEKKEAKKEKVKLKCMKTHRFLDYS